MLNLCVLPSCEALAFKCWVCPGGAASFAACDGFRAVEQCKQGTDSCGIFSFENATGFRIYAKSCTYRSWCGDADEFCKNIRQGKKVAKQKADKRKILKKQQLEYSREKRREEKRREEKRREEKRREEKRREEKRREEKREKRRED